MGLFEWNGIRGTVFESNSITFICCEWEVHCLGVWVRDGMCRAWGRGDEINYYSCFFFQHLLAVKWGARPLGTWRMDWLWGGNGWEGDQQDVSAFCCVFFACLKNRWLLGNGFTDHSRMKTKTYLVVGATSVWPAAKIQDFSSRKEIMSGSTVEMWGQAASTESGLHPMNIPWISDEYRAVGELVGWTLVKVIERETI